MGLNILENHFEGRSGVNQDEISINIMQSWNNTIADNFFDQTCEAISLGTSFGASYNNISPDFLTTIDRNHFYKCRNVTDHDASVFEKWTNNEFFEIEQLSLSGYSRHFLTEYGNNRFYNCPAVKADIDPYYATAIMLTGDGFDVHDNTIIDDRKLPDPTVAPVLSTVVGGSLGARTYYVKYTWSNYTDVTPPTAPTVVINTTAGNLSGDYNYKITFVDGEGETNGGQMSATVSPANQQVNLSNIPLGPVGVTSRKVYRYCNTVGKAYYRLVATISDNLTTTYADNISDGSLGAIMPLFNTTNSETLVLRFTIACGVERGCGRVAS